MTELAKDIAFTLRNDLVFSVLILLSVILAFAIGWWFVFGLVVGVALSVLR